MEGESHTLDLIFEKKRAGSRITSDNNSEATTAGDKKKMKSRSSCDSIAIAYVDEAERDERNGNFPENADDQRTPPLTGQIA